MAALKPKELKELKKKVEAQMKEIQGESWKSQNFYPYKTGGYHRKVDFDVDQFKPHIDVNNEFHAHCKVCATHIYTRSDKRDQASFYQAHINDEYHICRAAAWPVKLPMFVVQKTKVFCQVCKNHLEPEEFEDPTPLVDLLHEHVRDRKHVENARLFDDPKKSLLVSISMASEFQKCLKEKFCSVCQKWVSSRIGGLMHFRDSRHLKAFSQFLKNKLEYDAMCMPLEDLAAGLEKLILSQVQFDQGTENAFDSSDEDSDKPGPEKAQLTKKAVLSKKEKQELSTNKRTDAKEETRSSGGISAEDLEKLSSEFEDLW